MPAGRPAKFKTVAELEKKIDEYFEHEDAGDGIYTVPGLAVFLGFASRFSIQDYKENPTFSHTIKKALSRIEQQRLKMGLTGKANPAISIFDLKNNFGYQEKMDHNASGGFTLSWRNSGSGGDDSEK